MSRHPLPWRSITCALLLLAVSARRVIAQDHAVALHNAILRSGPSQTSKRLDVVNAGTVLALLPHRHRSGYYRVSTPDEEVGWVTGGAIRILDATETHVSEPPGTTTPGAPAAAVDVIAGAFDGCPVEGDPAPNGSNVAAIRHLNTLKNRSTAPADHDIDRVVTLDSLVGHATDDRTRFRDDAGAEISGYVLHVLPGGATETTNCRKGDPVHRDAHIELTLSATDTAENRRVVVEITPRWRAAMKDAHVDWSTTTLQHTIEGRWITVRGWLFFDSEHANDAENTHPGGASNWRATAWEVHPVTALTVLNGPP